MAVSVSCLAVWVQTDFPASNYIQSIRLRVVWMLGAKANSRKYLGSDRWCAQLSSANHPLHSKNDQDDLHMCRWGSGHVDPIAEPGELKRGCGVYAVGVRRRRVWEICFRSWGLFTVVGVRGWPA